VSYAQRPPTCVGCPAYEAGVSYVPGVGPATARYALVGQGPGEVEAHSHRPFCGPSGWKLDLWLTKAGLNRHQAWVDNVIRCQLPKNRTPKASELAWCTRAHLWPSLLQLDNLELIVPIGVPAMKALMGPKASERTAGTLTTVEVPKWTQF